MTMPLTALRGRVMDLDSHEQIPQDRYPEIFGERGKRFLEVSKGMFDMIEEVSNRISPGDGLHVNVPDTAEITEKAVWEKKGSHAPSHADMDRRPEVMDMMGVKRQLVFPTMGLAAVSQTQGGLTMGTFRPAPAEEQRVAWEAIDAYNDWAASVTARHSDRLRVAAILPSHKKGMTPEGLVKEAKRVIKLGARTIFIPAGSPPAGMSPDDKRLDPLYATLAEANVSLITHPPGGIGFRSQEWSLLGNPPPWQYIAEENFLALMIMGGVFERHPTLRFGIIEAGALWVGSFADLLDFHAGALGDHPVSFMSGYHLPLKPSEYLARNVRVTPMNFEPIEMTLERWPHLQDVFAFSTDYPHKEGQSYSLQKFYERLAPLGDKILEKFFVTNGELLIPS
ncbi:MAG TPA: amidohydrolase family protein [Rhizomicrobium sp.]|nr:amidohydrolase family protein [Rhizomicrobium sp.]